MGEHKWVAGVIYELSPAEAKALAETVAPSDMWPAEALERIGGEGGVQSTGATGPVCWYCEAAWVVAGPFCPVGAPPDPLD